VSLRFHLAGFSRATRNHADTRTDAENLNKTLIKPIHMSPKPIDGEKSGVQRLAGKYLTFALQRQSYGIDVLHVREIIRVTNITCLPQMPDYIRGVINLRGKIIPVMDLRLRFGFEAAQCAEQACIVVVLIKAADGKTSQMGLVVDNVEEVANVAASEIEETPNFGSGSTTECILGMAKVKGAIKTLLDIDRVIGADGHEVIRSAATILTTAN